VSARARILERVREALEGRPVAEHPGPFDGWRPEAPRASAADGFVALFEHSGGEVVRQPELSAAVAWLAGFAADFDAVTVGATVPDAVVPELPRAASRDAPLGISMALGAVAETGSLILDARDGRRAQLLAPTHVVLVHVTDVHATLRDALAALRGNLPSAIGLHSGPSKSADIGQIMVKGVHGPGRVVAALVGDHVAV
jgi:L-lactate dehydrogenase complex protein LldG